MTPAARASVGLVAAAVALGVLGEVLFHDQALGINVPAWTAAFVLALAALLRLGHVPLHQGRRWMVAPLLVFAGLFAWRSSPWLTAVNLIAIAGAVTLGALRRTKPRVDDADVADYAAGFAAAGAASLAGTVRLLQREVPWHEASRMRGGRPLAVGRGAAIAVPLLALFGGLFVAADAVFKSLVVSLVPSLDDVWTRVGLGVAFAWLSAGLLRDLLAERDDRRLVSPAALVSRLRWRLGGTELAVALAAVDVLFLAFVAVQLRYLFGGRGLVEARAHLTYAQYARHGFFELVVVAVLVLPLLLAADALTRGDDPRRVRLVRGLSAILVVLVLVVMASALQRLRLYQAVYGLTELRLYATGAVLWLAAVFAWLVVTVLRGHGRRFALGMVVAGFAAVLALDVANPDALIARTNTQRPRVDVAYLGGLSDDAVPALLERLPSLAPPLRSELARRLLERPEPASGWRGWNLARSSARDALAARRAELQRLAR